MLLTGAAGSGKTHLLNKFIARARGLGKSVAVTATTGLAATHLGGNTIHAWSGLGIRDEFSPYIVSGLSKSRLDIILKTNVLIIDEISMLHDFRLDMLDQLLRHIRSSERPFGGIQVILCGDFFQLPPINRQGSRMGSFVVESRVWQDSEFVICYLKGSHRQKDDAEFADLLNAIRANEVSEVQYERLQNRMQVFNDPFEQVTRLYTTNADVDRINTQQLEQIDSPKFSYHMQASGRKQYVETLKKSCLASEILVLKKGALVMCIKNSLDKKYVNGSLGVVVDFEGGTNYPVVELKNGIQVVIKPDSWELSDGELSRAQISQIPLRLAWAITVHKSQGMTLDAAEVDLSKAFTPGMGYVALSRVRNLQNLYLLGMNNMALAVSPVALEIEHQLQTHSQDAVNRFAEIFAKAEQRWINEANKPKAETSKAGPSKEKWSDRLTKMRTNHPNAFKPWHEPEDEQLISLHKSGSSIAEISEQLGRHEGSIKARLKKHFGEN